MFITALVRRAYLSILLVFLVAAILGCSGREEGQANILVFAAASLTDALGEIEREFEEQNELDVRISYGASQMLAQQINSGAPTDLFIPAGEAPASYLDERGLAEPQPTKLLSNKLVLVTRQEGRRLESLEQLTTDEVGRVAIASPELAPAGRYSRESLKRLGLWDSLQEKLIIGADVRATLAYVETGNADVAFVYQTDANIARNVTVLDIVPPDSYTPVVYPAVVIQRSEKKAATRRFLNFLRSEAAITIFRNHGFDPLAP